MAVGSRQILFSDSATPALSGQSPRQVSNLSDNSDVAIGTTAARNEPAANPSPGVSAPASGSQSAPAGPAGPDNADRAVQTEQAPQGSPGSRVDVRA